VGIPGLALCNAFCTQRWPCGPGDGRVTWTCIITRPPTCNGRPHVPTLSHDTRHTDTHLSPRSPTKWMSTFALWASIRISCGPPTLCEMGLHVTCIVEPRYASHGPPHIRLGSHCLALCGLPRLRNGFPRLGKLGSHKFLVGLPSSFVDVQIRATTFVYGSPRSLMGFHTHPQDLSWTSTLKCGYPPGNLGNHHAFLGAHIKCRGLPPCCLVSHEWLWKATQHNWRPIANMWASITLRGLPGSRVESHA